MLRSVEDFVGRTLILFWYLTAVYRLGGHILAHATGSLDAALITELLRSSGFLVFSLIICALTIVRHPPKQSAKGFEPRISALLGTYLTPMIGFFPSAMNDQAWLAFASAITAIGAVFSIYSLVWLGRSFSIMATARELVTGGPYRFVRHPLYAGEIVMIVGVMLANLSVPAVLICAATVGFQFRRMVNEERVLRASFPEYADYAQRVPRIIPRFSRRPALLAPSPGIAPKP